MGTQTRLWVKQPRKGDDIEREWINRGDNVRRLKPKVKGRGKGDERSGKGKKGDSPRNSHPIN